MVLKDPLWMQALTYSADEDRSFIQTVFAEGAFGDGLLVSQRAAGSNMSVDVAAGVCVIDGDDAANQGAYFCKSTEVVNVTLSAAPGVGNSRIDRIIAQVRDGTVLGNGTHDWVITKVTGTPGSSPSAPALPASAISLALVAVGSGVVSISNGNITDDRGTSAGVSTFSLADNAVTNDKLANGAVNAAALGVNAVAGDNIINGSIGTDELADDAVTEDKIDDGAVSTPKYADESITAGKLAPSLTEWQSYTPDILGGATLGNGTRSGRYLKIGDLVHACGRLTIGSTTVIKTVGNGPLVGLPFTAKLTSSIALNIGTAMYHQDAGRRWVGVCQPAAAQPNGLEFIQTTSSDAGYVAKDSPFTWATGDVLHWSIVFEEA